MGTNYYADSPHIPNATHVGKASYGRRFCFQGHPGLGITTFDDWAVVLGDPDCRIYSEYGDRISRKDLLTKIGSTMSAPNVGGGSLDGWGMPFLNFEFC